MKYNNEFLDLNDDDLDLSDNNDIKIKKDKKSKSKKGDIEKESAAELAELHKNFRAQKANEAKSFEDRTDSNFYTCIVFTTKEQAEEFNAKMGFSKDKVFIDGLDFCDKLKIELISPCLKKNNRKINDRWNELVLED